MEVTLGYIRLKAKICNPFDKSKNVELELLADTGAVYTGVPSRLLKSIGVVELSKRKFKLAKGRLEEYPVGEAYIEVEGNGVTSLVVFLPDDATPILGVTTLELLGLQVDLVTGKLKPLELYLLLKNMRLEYTTIIFGILRGRMYDMWSSCT